MEKTDNVEENSSGESSMIGAESLENVEKTGASSDERVLAEDAEIQVMCDLTPIQMGILGANKGVIDTAAPIDSVKDAVSRFGGIVDWKAHKVMAQEKHTNIQSELERALDDLPKYRKLAEEAEATKQQILSELDRTTKLVDELKASLERSRTEEAQARQDSEIAQARAREMEQGISDGASAAAKAQLDVARARHVAAVEELKSVAGELEGLRGDHRRLDDERCVAAARAEEAVSAARDAEKKAEGLTVELIAVREALEMAHASRLEAEERRIAITMVRDQDVLVGERELSQANEEMKQLIEVEDLNTKFEVASATLLNLKAELAFYAEGGSNKARKELEGMKAAIEKAKDGLNCLREAASSLRTELDRETETVAALQQRAEAVSSLEAELGRVQSELELITVDDIPRLMQQAARDADQSTSVARLAREELERAREEAEQARAGAMAAEARLVAVLEETESARASEALAVASMSKGVTLRLEEACKVLEEKKEALRVATEAADMAKEGMACAERELGDCRHLEKNPSESAAGGRGRLPGFHGPSMSCPDLYDDTAVTEAKARKKKPFFPRVVMFLARKKAPSPK